MRSFIFFVLGMVVIGGGLAVDRIFFSDGSFSFALGGISMAAALTLNSIGVRSKKGH